ncbi:MAG: adenylate/guanylate cyclase with Chase sensor [Proteobacteria bacterium]|nr:adenylate/guanylate cyclase with Chase sensor [Pseudomonadota bacterium]
MKQRMLSKRLNMLAVVLILLTVLCTELLFRSGQLAMLEYPWSDLWFRLAGQTHAARHLTVVEVDEETLDLYPDDPVPFWTPHFAKATGVLQAAGVKLIGLDFIFHSSPEIWLGRYGAHEASRNYNQSFRQTLAQGRIILGGAQPVKEARLPASEYVLSLPDFDITGHIGATDLVFDNDGTLRRITAMAPGARHAGADEAKLLSFPMLLAVKASGQDPAAASWKFGQRQIRADDPPWLLPYLGPPDSIPRLSMKELLVDNALANPKVQALRDRVVIVGARYASTNDAHLTPYGHGVFNARQMPGPEIHAQAAEALLTGHFIDPLTPGLRILSFVLPLLFAAWLWMRLTMWRGLPLLLGMLALAALIGFALHRLSISFPVAHLQLALIVLFVAIYGMRFSFGESERNLIRNVFSSYVSAEVVDEIVNSGHIPQLGGEAMPLTILFSDIRNFTTLSELLNPEEVVEILNTYFQRACAVLQAEGGCIDKFIGDAVMVEFGAPLPRPDDARRAMRAALRLHQTAVEFRTWMAQRFAGRELPLFDVGVGLHTGQAVVGNIGSPSKLQYTAIGDSVNLASRLEGITKQMGCAIVASRATIEAAGAGVILGKRDTVKVKGRHETVEVFEVLSLEESDHV